MIYRFGWRFGCVEPMCWVVNLSALYLWFVWSAKYIYWFHAYIYYIYIYIYLNVPQQNSIKFVPRMGLEWFGRNFADMKTAPFLSRLYVGCLNQIWELLTKRELTRLCFTCASNSFTETPQQHGIQITPRTLSGWWYLWPVAPICQLLRRSFATVALLYDIFI